MGRGPPAAIFNKLVRDYFRFNLKRKIFNSAKPLYAEMLAMENNPKMLAQAEVLQKKIDMAREQDEKDYKELKRITRGYPTKLNQLTGKEQSKYLTKGRRPFQKMYNIGPNKEDIKIMNELDFPDDNRY